MSETEGGSGDQAVRCPRCGTQNPRDAAQCGGCGDGLGPDQPAGEQMRRVSFCARLAVSLTVGLLVFGVACNVAYRQFCDSAVRYYQQFTLMDIGKVADAVEKYRAERGMLPRALTDLPQVTGLVGEAGWPVDYWRGRLEYRTEGTHYRITSYGQDGKPGGVGLDYDLSTDDPIPRNGRALVARSSLPALATPTFRQFVADRGEHANAGSGLMMFLMSILTGAVAFLLALRITGGFVPTRLGVVGLAVRLVVVAGATVFVGTLISVFHVPTGH